MGLENHRKSLIPYCEDRAKRDPSWSRVDPELISDAFSIITFGKSWLRMPKNGQFSDFLKSHSVTRQFKKNAKIEKFQCNILAFKVGK